MGSVRQRAANFLRKYLFSGPTEANTQLRLDTFRAFFLTQQHALETGLPPMLTTGEESRDAKIPDIPETAEETYRTYDRQRVYAHHYIERQIENYIDRLHAALVARLLDDADDLPKSGLPYYCKPAPSLVKGAGSGVFLEKVNETEFDTDQIPPGTVVGLYPGEIIHPTRPEVLIPLIQDEHWREYAYARRDGVIIAPKADQDFNIYRPLMVDDEGLRQSQGDVVRLPVHNPLAIGHLLNHPEQGVEPNVMAFQHDIIEKNYDLHIAERFLPLSWRGRPRFPWNITETLFPTVAIITTRWVKEGEELYLNYRYNPDLERPSWYHPVDEEEDRRRWSKD
eukprot:Clim_evm28s150 gene=Clim_evmTU28s150